MNLIRFIMRKLKPAAFVVIAFAAMTLLASSAMAACSAGRLCFWDRDGNNRMSWVEYDNDNWGVFRWDNRADEFFNNGRHYNVCIHTGYGFRFLGKQFYGGKKHLIRRGHHFKPGWWNVFRNTVSSNKWTSRSRC